MRVVAAVAGLALLTASCTGGSGSTQPDGSQSVPPATPSDQPASLDSCRWQVVSTPNRSPSVLANQLTAISASGPSDAWAVGTAQQRGVEGGVSSPLLVHWDGKRWRLVASAPTAPNAFLLGVASISSQDAWAVGFAGSRSGGHQPLVEHWNGSSWSAVAVPAPPGVASASLGVFAVSADDVWAVGNTERGEGATLIEHWDGSRWVMTPSANASPLGFESAPDNALVAVGASSHNEVVAVGTTRDGGHVYHADPLIENWNGTSWAIVPASVPSSGAKTFLESVAVASATDAWAVGASSPANATGGSPFIEHWDGSSWASVGAAALTRARDTLRSGFLRSRSLGRRERGTSSATARRARARTEPGHPMFRSARRTLSSLGSRSPQMGRSRRSDLLDPTRGHWPFVVSRRDKPRAPFAAEPSEFPCNRRSE